MSASPMALPPGAELVSPLPQPSFKLPPGAELVSQGHEPTVLDQVKDSAKFLGNEGLGVLSGINPFNIAKGIYHMVTTSPVTQYQEIMHIPDQLADQYNSGDMEGLAKSLGQLAANATFAKMAPDVVDAVKSGLNSPIIPAISAGATAATKAAIPALVRNIPIVGKPLGLAIDAAKPAYQAAKAAATPQVESTPTPIDPESVPDKPPGWHLNKAKKLADKLIVDLFKNPPDTNEESSTPVETSQITKELTTPVADGQEFYPQGQLYKVKNIPTPDDLGVDNSDNHITSEANQRAYNTAKYAFDNGINNPLALDKLPADKRLAFIQESMDYANKIGLSNPKPAYTPGWVQDTLDLAKSHLQKMYENEALNR